MIGRRLLSSLLRAGALALAGMLLMSTDAAIARQFAIPALAPVLLSAGWLCVAAAISHVARVILFPRIDLIETGLKAVRQNNIAAGLVFAGICLVLAALLLSQART
mgnify:CR=1 FL=1